MLNVQFYYIIEFGNPLVALERCDAEQWAEHLEELMVDLCVWRCTMYVEV